MPATAVQLLVAALAAVNLDAADLTGYLRTGVRPPVEYVMSKVASHRIVILGEGHWGRRDAELVVSLVPHLAAERVALAVEMFAASEQPRIDAVLAAERWDPLRANEILRTSDWPYVQYRDILRAAWQFNKNRTPGAPGMRIIAAGPPDDFRERGIPYDQLLAGPILDYATDESHRVVVYCGMHHAFTRFQQIERMRNGRPGEFMVRMGNILWQKLGEDAFLIALHKTEGCAGWESPNARVCPPLAGLIDCAAVAAGSRPVGFDILASPIAETKLDPSSFYAIGHPLVRMIDYADGYIWFAPIDETRLVDVIPLAEYDPSRAGNEDTQASWKKMIADHANPLARSSWKDLPQWRSRCPAAAKP